MITLLTPVSMPAGLPCIRHEDRLMAIGSCFATAMGGRLSATGFRCDINPFGTLYNPLSIAMALQEIADGRTYAPADLFPYNGCWHSPMHHGDFSAPTPEAALCLINSRLHAASALLPRLDFLLLTFGSAVVYEDNTTCRIVGNCHKLPERNFRRRRLPVDEITRRYVPLFTDLFTRNPRLKVVLTVSPVRYLRDGIH